MLRPRQQQAIEAIRQAYRDKYRSPLLCAATGFGKSHTASVIIRDALKKGKTVWFLAHLKEILNATSAKLDSERIAHGWIAAGKKPSPQHVQLAMIQSLARRLDKLSPPDLMIVDEAHLAVSKTYQDVFEWAPKSYRLHLTATPTRLDGRGLGEIADIIIPTCSTQDLIDEGLLAPIRYFAPQTMDFSGLKTVGGDYSADDLAEAMNKPSITGDAVREYRKVAHGRPAIAFCVSIKHAQDVAAAFCEAGYRAVAISGESDAEARDSALAGLKDGSLDVVCNVFLWVAGVDLPEVSCIIMLSPTKSLTKYLQSIGRGLRIHPGKPDCVIIDHAGNLAEHGNPAAMREWTLDAKPEGKKKKKPEVSIKTCPVCMAVVYSLATECACGHKFEPMPREIKYVDGELAEIELKRQEEIQKRERRKQQGRAQTFDELVAVGVARKMANPYGWAKHVFNARQNRR